MRVSRESKAGSVLSTSVIKFKTPSPLTFNFPWHCKNFISLQLGLLRFGFFLSFCSHANVTKDVKCFKDTLSFFRSFDILSPLVRYYPKDSPYVISFCIWKCYVNMGKCVCLWVGGVRNNGGKFVKGTTHQYDGIRKLLCNRNLYSKFETIYIIHVINTTDYNSTLYWASKARPKLIDT